LELSKLGSILGSFLRVFGLSIAARIDNCKVCRGTKNPRTYRAGSVKVLLPQTRCGQIIWGIYNGDGWGNAL
ncbi:hypothetical protein, partial [Coleofasciculus sp. G3-WIS-01]|uniref:hypothetical protein n=1 Tax=Coleofasciculus sp. G3-WIS-01 TaxID=3069528 RepID=UPI004064331F